MSEYSDFLKHLGIDKKQMIASMWSKISDSEKPSKRDGKMTDKEIARNVKYDKSMLVTEKLFLVEDK